MRHRSHFWIPQGLRSLFPAGLILGLTLVPAGLAGAHPCDSSKQNIRDGDIHTLEIVNAVDRDGDGYYSSFSLKLVSDTRVSRPRRQGKEAFRKVYNTLSQFFPAPPAPGKACFDLIPGYLFKGRVAPLTKRLEDTDFEGNELPPMGSPTPIEHQLGVHKPHSKDSYPGPGQPRDVSHFLVAPIEKDSNGNPYVESFRTRSGDDMWYVGETPTGMTDLLPEQWSHGLLWVGVETCWRVWARGKARYTGGDLCLTPEDFGDMAKMLGGWATGGGSKASIGQAIRIERPEHDQPVPLRVESTPGGAEIALETRPRVAVEPKENGLKFNQKGSPGEKVLGTTDWQGELPPESFEQGVVLHARKSGHGSASHKLGSGDKNGTVRFDLQPELAHTLVIDGKTVDGASDYEFAVSDQLRQVSGKIGGDSVTIRTTTRSRARMLPAA